MYGRYSTGGFELFMEFKGDPKSTLFSVFKFDLNTMEWYDGYISFDDKFMYVMLLLFRTVFVWKEY